MIYYISWEVINMKNILILGGYSKNNIPWINNIKEVFKNDYNINIIKYDNWYNDLEMDYDIEIDKIYSSIIDNKIDTIIAKSIGIYLVVKLLDKMDIKLDNIIFMGYPLKVLKENNIDINNNIININKKYNLYFIEQENDILCSYDELVNLFSDINVIKINGSDHSYSNYDDLKMIIDELINNKVKTIIHNKDNLSNKDITELVIRSKGLLINDRNEILIAKENNVFEFPGGHLEENETLNECLKREILEETGIVLDDNEFNNYFFKVIYKNKDYPTKCNNRMCEIYYYIIKTNKKPNTSKLNLTEMEKINNFNVNYYKLDEVIKVLIDNLETDERNYAITPDMILAIEEYLKDVVL